MDNDKTQLAHCEVGQPLKILLASSSAIKIDATRKAFQELFPKHFVEVVSIKAKSEINEQPVGHDETLKGAMNRLKNAKNASQDHFDFTVAIENGIFPATYLTTTTWFDVGIVVVANAIGKESFSVSTAVQVPSHLVEEAMKKGFATTTFGSVLKQKNNSVDENDPHRYLTNNLFCRESLLISTIKTAVCQLQVEKI